MRLTNGQKKSGFPESRRLTSGTLYQAFNTLLYSLGIRNIDKEFKDLWFRLQHVMDMFLSLRLAMNKVN